MKRGIIILLPLALLIGILAFCIQLVRSIVFGLLFTPMKLGSELWVKYFKKGASVLAFACLGPKMIMDLLAFINKPLLAYMLYMTNQKFKNKYNIE